jgi:NhaP-type Na+/H+ or K+/H+ antiporter
MESNDHSQVILTLVLAGLAGALSQSLGQLSKIPSIVLLLLAGVLLGPEGLCWIQPGELGTGLEVVVNLGVALILFEGGCQLSWQKLSSRPTNLTALITLGVGISILGGSVAVHFLSEFPWNLSILFATIVSVTGPTVIGPLLMQFRVEPDTRTLLESEGILIDPIVAILSVAILNLITRANYTWQALLVDIGGRFGIGALVGLIGMGLLYGLLKLIQPLPLKYRSTATLACVLLAYGLAQGWRSEAGLLTVVIMGMIFANLELPDRSEILQFLESMTLVAIALLFILLSANLPLSGLLTLGAGGLLTVLALMLIVRPLSILICTAGAAFGWPQRLFMCWVAPRGVVAASIASLFAISLTDQGISGGEALKAQVFLTIFLTVLLQGLTAGPLARILGLVQAESLSEPEVLD